MLVFIFKIFSYDDIRIVYLFADMSYIQVEFVQDNIIYNCSISHVKNHNELQKGDIRNVKWKDAKFYKAVVKEICKCLHCLLTNFNLTTSKSNNCIGKSAHY